MVSKNETSCYVHCLFISNQKCVYENIEDKCKNCDSRGFDCSTSQKTLGPKQAQAIISALEKTQRDETESPAQIIARYEEQQRNSKEELIRNFWATQKHTSSSQHDSVLTSTSRPSKKEEHQHRYDGDESCYSSP